MCSTLVLSLGALGSAVLGSTPLRAKTSVSAPPTAPSPFVGVTCGKDATNATIAAARYCNDSLSVSERVEAIISLMTNDEKVSMLDASNIGVPRLGIRQMQFGEGLHGVFSNCGKAVGEPDEFGPRTGCATSYPSGIAEGATFNKSLWRTVGAADGREGRALHNQNGTFSGHGLAALAFWAPDCNLFRDPRWGRGQEVPGEDPVLTSWYVKGFSTGLQHGDSEGATEWLQIISTCKHFFGYDVETTRDSNNENISAKMLSEYYLPVFKTCIQDAKVKGVMCSYNAVNGVPSCANSKFQNGLLRAQWGWDGYSVSDCGAIRDIYLAHHYTDNWDATVAAALRGGTDIECDNVFLYNASNALASGAINTSDLDTALRRRLPHFIALGEMHGPAEVPYQSYGPELVDTREHRLLSLSVAEQSMTLLKNEAPAGHNEPLLPLSRTAKIALIGPQANFTLEMLSNYEGENTLVLTQSPLMAARRAGLDIVYAAGHSPDVSNPSREYFFEAIAAAQAADVAIVMVGLCADHCAGNGRTENEGNDRGPGGSGAPTLGLPGAQQELLEAVMAVNPRTVLVMMNGGMLAIPWAKANVPSILEAYYPGQLGGTAIVRTLLGENNPGGKTPITWYPEDYILSRSIQDMDLTSGQGLTHLYYEGETLWPFGFGLSYTTFSYKWDQTSRAARTFRLSDLAGTSTYATRCVVTNTGHRVGDAVVLGFVTNASDPDFPKQKLFDFDRVTLLPGESRTVTLQATAEHLSVVTSTGDRWLRPMVLTIQVGDVVSPVTHKLTLLGSPVLLEDLASFL